MQSDLSDIPLRSGLPPHTNPTMPHQQLSENAPKALQEAIFERAKALPGVTVGPSLVSVPGARAFVLDESKALGPKEAFMAGREFAHLHPEYDGSLHLALPPKVAKKVIESGWGEFHPAVELGLIPPTSVMVYGPRDDAECATVWQIIEASHRFACGEA